MKRKLSLVKLAVPVVAASLLSNTVVLRAQGELVPMSLTGGPGIFVLRGSARPAPRTFVSARATRSKSQRIESAKRVSKQYTTLAKVAPRRTRTTAVTPNDPRLKEPNRMERGEASKLFAGVGEYWMDRDNYAQAIDMFREALTLNSANTVAQTGLSEALALQGNQELVRDSFPVALTMFDEALKYNKNNAPAYFGRAEVLTEMAREALEKGNKDRALEFEKEAIASYENALKTDAELSEIYTPLGALYFQKGEIAKADEYLTKAIAASPNDPQAQYQFGLVKFTQGRDQEALTAFRKSASLDATNADVARYAGETLLRTDKAGDAIAEFDKATKLRANYFEAWMGLGAANYETGNFAEAVKAYTRASQLRNDSFEAFNNLGDSHRQTTPPNYALAEANYNLAATFIQKREVYNKEDAADMYSKAAFSIAKQCEINIKRARPCRWDAAVTALENADKLSTTGIDAANLGWAYYSAAREDIFNGKTAEARPKLEKAKLNLQRVVGSNAKFVSGPMLNLGMALVDLGEHADAIKVLNEVAKKEPKWAFPLNELGLAYRAQGNYKEAAKQFKAAIDKDKSFADAYYNLAESQFKDGNLGEARKNWDSLKKMGRNDLAAKLDVVTNGGLRQGS